MMGALRAPVAIAGVDGCKAGWIAVIMRRDAAPTLEAFTEFEALVDALDGDAVIAVDMPIGLPERSGRGGRGPEALLRPHLGQRQSSVFSIPSRAAIYAEPGPFGGVDEWYAAHRRASAVARETSDPPRGVSIQAFGIFSRIREIDALLRRSPALAARIVESHPEAAFWRLNGEIAMATPKKIKGRINPAGMAERRTLLARLGLPSPVLKADPPRGAATDDLLDAAAVLFIAARHARGEAVAFPDPPLADAHGLPVAIWT